MPETLITLQKAAKLSGKSPQTIRRAIKAKRVKAKKKKTPQGFNYLVNKESLAKAYKIVLTEAKSERKQRNIGSKNKKNIATKDDNYATLADLSRLQKDIEVLLQDHEKEKATFIRFMKTIQDKFVVMENQLKLLEEPKKRAWYEFWK